MLGELAGPRIVASMRPRLKAAENTVKSMLVATRKIGFNEAAA